MSNKTLDKKNIQLKHGVIILCDVLGTKYHVRNDVKSYVCKISSIYEYLEEIIKQIKDIFNPPPDKKFLREKSLAIFNDIINGASNYLGDKIKDMDQIAYFKFEPEIVTFSDTILFIIYTNNEEIKNDQILLLYCGLIFSLLFRNIFAIQGLLLRGAISIGDFYLYKDGYKSLFLGEPMFELSALYESTNWGGIITAPSSTIILDQLFASEAVNETTVILTITMLIQKPKNQFN